MGEFGSSPGTSCGFRLIIDPGFPRARFHFQGLASNPAQHCGSGTTAGTDPLSGPSWQSPPSSRGHPDDVPVPSPPAPQPIAFPCGRAS